jgi:hypothetical protein
VIQGRDAPGFALEAGFEVGIRGERGGQNLDRDRAIEARVFRLVDLAHAAGADRGEDFVRTEALSQRQ